MKSICLKVMTLLMAALVLSASGCFNDEMSSPEGTVKASMKAMNQKNSKKMLSYIDPREMTEELKQFTYRLASSMRRIKFDITDVKTTLVSKKEGRVMLDDKKWHRVKNENATVEVSFKFNGENVQLTDKLVLLDNKWYIINGEELGP